MAGNAGDRHTQRGGALCRVEHAVIDGGEYRPVGGLGGRRILDWSDSVDYAFSVMLETLAMLSLRFGWSFVVCSLRSCPLDGSGAQS
jgi:hypothetical protein